MGLRNRIANRRMGDPVQGDLQVTGSERTSGQKHLVQGVLSGEGIAPHAVELTVEVPLSHSLFGSRTLPVVVDRANTTHVQVLWDRVPSTQDTLSQQAMQRAQDLASGTGPGPAPGGAGVVFGAGADLSALPPQARAMVEQVLSGQLPAGATRQVSVTVNGVPVSGGAVPGFPGAGFPGGGFPGGAPAGFPAAAAPATRRHATARLLAVHPVPIPPGTPGAPPGGVLDLTLDVTPQQGPGWTAVTRIAFSSPERRQRVETVGMTLPVVYDPADPTRVDLDRAALGFDG